MTVSASYQGGAVRVSGDTERCRFMVEVRRWQMLIREPVRLEERPPFTPMAPPKPPKRLALRIAYKCVEWDRPHSHQSGKVVEASRYLCPY